MFELIIKGVFMGRVKDFFQFVRQLEKTEGYDPNKKVEKGFYLRTMGLSAILVVILVILILSLIVKF